MALDKVILSALLAIATVAFPKTKTDGYEKYNSYEQSTYLDNLETNITSQIIWDSYYSKLSPKDYSISQVIDTVNRKRELRIETKKARSGYLFVNKVITKQLNDDGDHDMRSISYFVDDKMVSTDKEIHNLLRIRTKDIDVLRLTVFPDDSFVCVYIYSKRLRFRSALHFKI